METASSSTAQLRGAVLRVDTISSGRSRVTFRAARSAANPSGLGVAHTALLDTESGRAVSASLRRRERTWPLTLLRTTTIGVADEHLADGSTMRIITEAGPA
jgi:hypothetical protein